MSFAPSCYSLVFLFAHSSPKTMINKCTEECFDLFHCIHIIITVVHSKRCYCQQIGEEGVSDAKLQLATYHFCSDHYLFIVCVCKFSYYSGP